MSIKLDWEVESEGGWAEVGEDAAALAARQRRARRTRRFAIALLAVGLIIGGGIGLRLYTADQQSRADLRSTVASETAAIRIGDSSAYLDLQQDVGSWRQMQSERFGQYQAESGHLKADGEIVQLDIDGGKGRVVVRETLDGKPYNETWFYQHGDDGWKHVPPEIAFWGWPRVLNSAHYAINTWDEDMVFATKLQARLEEWWEAACRLTGCRNPGGKSPDVMKVRIEPDPLLKLGWAAYDNSTLRIPSPLLGRVPADGSLDPTLEQAVAAYVADYWARTLLAKPADDFGDQAWAADEFRQWLVSAFAEGAPPAPLLGPLADTQSPEAVMALLQQVGQKQEVVTALKQITGKDVTDLPVGWDRYFTYRLRAEVALVHGNHRTEALLLYRDPERAGQDVALDLSPVDRGLAPTISVLSTRRVGDLVWAETQFTWMRNRFEGPDVEQMVTYEPFRLVGDRWVHTSAWDTDYGPRQTQNSQHVSLSYYDIDTPSVDGLLPSLEQIAQQAAADLRLDPPAANLDLSPYARPDPNFSVNLIIQGDDLTLISPYSGVNFQNPDARAYVTSVAAQGIVYHLVKSRAPAHRFYDPLVLAFTQRELQHLGLADDIVSKLHWLDSSAVGPPQSLEEFWANAEMGTDGYFYAYHVAGDTLVSLLIEKYGDQATPLLLQNLPMATSMDGWLTSSLGIHVADVEPEWKSRLAVALNAAR